MEKFVPLGDDLYNGVPGVAIFHKKLLKVYSEEQYKRLLDLEKNRMFAYTNSKYLKYYYTQKEKYLNLAI